MDAYGTLFLQHDGRKIATAMKNDNSKQQEKALLETPLAKRWARDERTLLVTKHTATVLPYHIFNMLLKPVKHTFGTNLQPNTLLEIEKIPFFLLNN